MYGIGMRRDFLITAIATILRSSTPGPIGTSFEFTAGIYDDGAGTTIVGYIPGFIGIAVRNPADQCQNFNVQIIGGGSPSLVINLACTEGMSEAYLDYQINGGMNARVLLVPDGSLWLAPSGVAIPQLAEGDTLTFTLVESV